MTSLVCDEVDAWTPVRDGDVYCAPRCGLRCKWIWYENACASANDLCKALGEGWKPRVWENLGWYYTVSRGKFTVSEHKHDGAVTFSCSFDSNAKQYYVTCASSAREAVAEAIAEARADIRQLERELAVLETVDLLPLAFVADGEAQSLPAPEGLSEGDRS